MGHYARDKQRRIKIAPAQRQGVSGQSTVETLLTFIVIIFFFCGIFSIWVWGMKQIVQRQTAYNSTRVEAGTSSDAYVLQWPPPRSEHLTEEMVFPGSP